LFAWVTKNQGCRDARSVSWIKLTRADTMTVAAKVAETAQQYRLDAIFIDGGGPGGGEVNRLRQLQARVHRWTGRRGGVLSLTSIRLSSTLTRIREKKAFLSKAQRIWCDTVFRTPRP
jgi:hypothetical protein